MLVYATSTGALDLWEEEVLRPRARRGALDLVPDRSRLSALGNQAQQPPCEHGLGPNTVFETDGGQTDDREYSRG